MKKKGWILSVSGALACLGALTAGHNISGPLFFIATGLMLINKTDSDKRG